MNKNNVWVLFFITALIIFMIFSIHRFNKATLDEMYFNDYSKLIETIDDQVSYMTYGNNEDNLKDYYKLTKLISETKQNIKTEDNSLMKKLFKREINLGQYIKLKDTYSFNLKRLDIIVKNLQAKID